MAKWKLVAPKSGEDQTKSVNGKTFHWCGKCGNWTTTHSTESHTGTSPQKNSSNKSTRRTPSSAESNLVSWEPSAWLLEAQVVPSPTTSAIVRMLQYTYFVLTLGILLGLPVPTVNDLLQSAAQSDQLNLVMLTSWSFIKRIMANICGVYLRPLLCLIGPMSWFVAGYCACKVPY